MQLTILHSKDHAIAFSTTKGITIQDSQLQAAGVFGIWSGSDQSSLSSNVSITNNLIQDVQSNGVFLSFTQNTTIKGNTLKHNHHVALFNLCSGLCPGGQLDMLDNASLQIYSNEIIDGQIDLNNANGQTNGIEIADPNDNITITNNEIANNLGPGIAAHTGSTGMNFQITGNKSITMARTFPGSQHWDSGTGRLLHAVTIASVAASQPKCSRSYHVK